MVYVPVSSWTTNTGFNVNGGTLTGSTNTTVHAKSCETIASGDSIKINWHNQGTFIAGFGIDPISQSYTTLEYGFFCDNTKWKIYESGVKTWDSNDFSTYNTNAEAKIERDGSNVKYYLNNNLVKTTSSNASAQMYVHAMTSGTANAGSATITGEMQSCSSGGGSSGGGEEEGSGSGSGGSSGGNNVIEGEGNYIDHILYMKTVVPR